MKLTHVFFIALLIIAGFIFVMHNHAADQYYVGKVANWHRYYSPDGNLSATLPSKPNVSTSSGGYHMTSVLSNYQSYIVTDTHLATSVEDKSDQAFAAVRRAYRKQGYTVIATRDVQVDGHPGQEVHFETSTGLYGWNRMFLIDGDYYQLLYMTKQDRPAPVRFWQSLVLSE